VIFPINKNIMGRKFELQIGLKGIEYGDIECLSLSAAASDSICTQSRDETRTAWHCTSSTNTSLPFSETLKLKAPKNAQA
jgi:hypothetical protein